MLKLQHTKLRPIPPVVSVDGPADTPDRSASEGQNTSSMLVPPGANGVLSAPNMLAPARSVEDGPTPPRNSPAVSFDDLAEQQSRVSTLSEPHDRPQTLDDYERNLTVQGDDRRRRSTVNVHKLREVQEDDRNYTHLHGQRSMSLYGPNVESGEHNLMAQALYKHQKEKAALFRPRIVKSNSKINVPVFNMTFGPSTSPGKIMSDVDDFDPLGEMKVRRAQSVDRFHSVSERVPTPMPCALRTPSRATNVSVLHKNG